VHGDFRIVAHGIGAAQAPSASARLPMRNCTQPMLSMMKGSPGAICRPCRSAWLPAGAVAFGQRVAQRVVGVLVVGRQRHHLAQGFSIRSTWPSFSATSA
jgi:hypothetical protein